MQSFEEDYFRTAYKNYDRQNPSYKMDFYHRLVITALPSVSKPRVLDMGCAFGKFLSSLNPDWSLYGVDSSSHAVAEAHKRLPHAHLSVSSATEIPFEGRFDVITAFDVIEHIPDLEQVAETVAKRLNPEGRFIFVVPVYDGPLGPVIRILDRDPTHLHKASRDFWLAWADRHFGIEQWCGITRYLLPGGFYFHWPTRLARRWAPAIAVIARPKSLNAHLRGTGD
ncbi:MAG: class I SAM-dependent methyltransferase [Nitrospirae bacterium]|nr:class I SAM-dependent methyltransferase [Nitrospirota bacterium]